jgi:putative FmdB family regulatory protein
MPLYEYECEACGKRFERIQKFSDPLADVCPHCGKGPVRKLFSSPAIQFKGSGWYINDYAKKGKSDPGTTSSQSKSSTSDSSSSSSSDSSSSSASTGSKPDSTTSSDKKS